MAENKRKTKLYVDGNTIRKVQPEPIRRQREVEKEQEERRVSNRTRKNRERAMHMNGPYVLFLIAVVIVTTATLIDYINLQSEVSDRVRNIASLESDLSDLQSENDAEYTNMTESVDLEYIYKVATEQLGMVYANKDQVVIFEGQESQYVTQYEDIPTSEEGK